MLDMTGSEIEQHSNKSKREVTRAEKYRARTYFHPDKHANVLIVKLH